MRKGGRHCCKEEILSLIETIRPYARKNGAETYIDDLRTIVTRGPSYVRQRKVFETTNDFITVTDHLLKEFEEGKPSYV